MILERLNYETFTSVVAILELLDDFPCPRSSSPYQRIEYLKLAVRRHHFYSIVRLVRPFFIKFNIEGRAAIIMPFSKSILNSEYFMFGDRAGFGYLDIICRDDLSAFDIRACFDLLMRDFSRSVFHFNRVRKNSTNYGVLKSIAIPTGHEECVTVDLVGNYDDYLKSLSKSSRQNYRTANNRIAKASKQLSFRRLNGNDISQKVVDDMTGLYLNRLRSYKKHVGFVDRIFYRFIDLGFVSIRTLDFSEVCLLYIDERLAAFMICLANGDELSVPRLAIDESFSFYSPGVLLVISAIKDLLDEGIIRTLDFMQGNEGYKFQVGGRIQECYSFEFSN